MESRGTLSLGQRPSSDGIIPMAVASARSPFSPDIALSEDEEDDEEENVEVSAWDLEKVRRMTVLSIVWIVYPSLYSSTTRRD